MAKKYLVSINLNRNELQNAVIQNLAAAPSSPTAGLAYYDTTLGKFGVYSGTQWVYMGDFEQYTDEQAQDAIGSMLTDSATIDFVYDDVANTITANVLDAPTVGGRTPAYLMSRANHTGTQTASTISDFASSVDTRIAGAAGVTIAQLVDGKVPTSQLPSLALSDVNVVSSQTAQLALDAQEGDIAIRSDLSKSYIHNGGTSGTMADWTELASPTDAVTSVNGQTGAVVLGKADIGLGNVDNTSDADKPISTATQTALNGKLTATSNLSDVANAATAFSNIKQNATTTTTGVVELATVTEAKAKSSSSVVVTPAGLADFARVYTALIGDGTGTTFAVTHGLGSQWVTASVYEASTNAEVECDVALTSATQTTFTFNTAPTANQYRVVITG